MFAELNPAFCQNGPDLRLNSHACFAPASTGRCIANSARSKPIPPRRSSGATATLRISACCPSSLLSYPVVAKMRPVVSSREIHQCTLVDSSPLSVRSARLRNSEISALVARTSLSILQRYLPVVRSSNYDHAPASRRVQAACYRPRFSNRRTGNHVESGSKSTTPRSEYPRLV